MPLKENPELKEVLLQPWGWVQGEGSGAAFSGPAPAAVEPHPCLLSSGIPFSSLLGVQVWGLPGFLTPLLEESVDSFPVSKGSSAPSSRAMSLQCRIV